MRPFRVLNREMAEDQLCGPKCVIVPEFLQIVQNYSSEVGWVFRGQDNIDWPLRPKAGRDALAASPDRSSASNSITSSGLNTARLQIASDSGKAALLVNSMESFVFSFECRCQNAMPQLRVSVANHSILRRESALKCWHTYSRGRLHWVKNSET